MELVWLTNSAAEFLQAYFFANKGKYIVLLCLYFYWMSFGAVLWTETEKGTSCL